LKREVKRLRNRVADVTKSRQEWRAEVEHLRQRLRQRDQELATLKAPPGRAGAGGKSAAGGVGLVG
jgi:prefoldin subunit 5